MQGTRVKMRMRMKREKNFVKLGQKYSEWTTDECEKDIWFNVMRIMWNIAGLKSVKCDYDDEKDV